jgi:hypothetical protein
MQRPTARIFWLIALSLFGVIPILLTLAWVNGNMTLPGEMHRLFQEKFSWPWFSYQESSPLICAEVDFIITAAAYLLTALATNLRIPQIRRAFIVTVLGLTLFSVMSCWQYTGVIVWSLRWPQYFSDTLYYALIIFGVAVGFRALDPKEVLGYTQIYSPKDATPVGAFPRSRGYLFLMIAFFCTPVMGLDRLIFSVVTLLFLIILIRLIRFSALGKPARS